MMLGCRSCDGSSPYVAGNGMNMVAIRKFREKLAAKQAVYGLWVTLKSASATEMAVALGLDWVVIDAERFQQGFRMFALGLDAGLLLRSLHESQAAVGRDRKVRSGFRVNDDERAR
jgi:hypothetical protein